MLDDPRAKVLTQIAYYSERGSPVLFNKLEVYVGWQRDIAVAAFSELEGLGLVEILPSACVALSERGGAFVESNFREQYFGKHTFYEWREHCEIFPPEGPVLVMARKAALKASKASQARRNRDLFRARWKAGAFKMDFGHWLFLAMITVSIVLHLFDFSKKFFH